MDVLARYVLAQALNNAWANDRLLSACSRLTQADFEAPRTGFFPSIRATLNHNLTVDWYYIDAIKRALSGAPANARFAAFFDPPEPFASCLALQAEQSASDHRLIALCNALDADGLAREVAVPRGATVVPEELSRLLAHLFQHQVHHRGQAHAMLSATPVAPPQLDEFFCSSDAPLRAADMKRLGFVEGAIWRAPG